MLSTNPHDRIMVAINPPSLAGAERLLDDLQKVGLVSAKVGKQLINAPDGGTSAMAAMLSRRGLLQESLLDNKEIDTPETMASAVLGIRANGFKSFTVMLDAGFSSLKACVAQQGDTIPVGVTLLTSLGISDLHSLGYAQQGTLVSAICKRIDIGRTLGITTFVAGPADLHAFREEGIYGDCSFLTPAIRPSGARPRGQKRMGTPRLAIRSGARRIIVGSPVTDPQQGSPADAYLRICDEVVAAL